MTFLRGNVLLILALWFLVLAVWGTWCAYANDKARREKHNARWEWWKEHRKAKDETKWRMK